MAELRQGLQVHRPAAAARVRPGAEAHEAARHTRQSYERLLDEHPRAHPGRRAAHHVHRRLPRRDRGRSSRSSMDFIADVGFDHVGVFTYSHEEGTSALRSRRRRAGGDQGRPPGAADGDARRRLVARRQHGASRRAGAADGGRTVARARAGAARPAGRPGPGDRPGGLPDRRRPASLVARARLLDRRRESSAPTGLRPGCHGRLASDADLPSHRPAAGQPVPSSVLTLVFGSKSGKPEWACCPLFVFRGLFDPARASPGAGGRVAASYGLDIFDVELKREGGQQVLRVVLDRPGPTATAEESVSIEDCARVSRGARARFSTSRTSAGRPIHLGGVVAGAGSAAAARRRLPAVRRTLGEDRDVASRSARQTAFAGRLRGVEGDDVLFESEGGQAGASCRCG